LIAAHAPDVVTLDLEMPHVSGIETIHRIMSEHPTPVVLLSSFAQSNAAVTLEALGAGAVDFVDKARVSSMDLYALAEELIRKIKMAARSRPRAVLAVDESAPIAAAPRTIEVLVVGASTGGPPAIERLVSSLPRAFEVPVLVVQHMPVGFTRAFAERLDARCALDVREAEDGDRVDAGRVLIAPGGRRFGVRRAAGCVEAVVANAQSDARAGVRDPLPSVDAAAVAAASVYGRGTCLAVLTGMGSDGVRGARAVRGAGGLVLAQSEASCVVFGMPRAVIREGLASVTLGIDAMADWLRRIASGTSTAHERGSFRAR
jgi:two-component system chemotaxis response regulator CheB